MIHSELLHKRFVAVKLLENDERFASIMINVVVGTEVCIRSRGRERLIVEIDDIVTLDAARDDTTLLAEADLSRDGKGRKDSNDRNK